MPSDAEAGWCSECGQRLVQTSDRTYHPAEVLDGQASCPVLLLIPGTQHHSHDVPADVFRPGDPPTTRYYPADDTDHDRCWASEVIKAFEARGNVTDARVAEAGGPSSTFMTALRKAVAGRPLSARPRNSTLERVDAAAGWRPGTARRLWDEPLTDTSPHERSEAEELPRLRGTMDDVSALARSYATVARARGLGEEERRWLDMLAVIERGTA